MRGGAWLAFSALLGGCSLTGPCSNDVAERVHSPDGRHDAVIFQRSCGATTGFTTQIGVVDAGAAVSGKEPVFVADSDYGAARLGAWQGPWAEVRWLAPDHLLVRYAVKSRLFARKATASGVKVSYQIVADER